MTLLKRKSIEAVASRRPARAKREDHLDHDDEPKRMAPRFAPVTFSELAGVRYLHFGTEWVQGAMRLSKPDAIELEYAQQMMAWLLFLDPAARPDFHVVQLGLGAAALTKFCHRQLAPAKVTAVELNPSVIVAARSMFGLPFDDARLSVLEQDAYDWVMDASHHGTVDALQIDLYDATARGPVLDTPAFYKACRQVLRAPGVMTINLFGDHTSFPRNIERICDAFDNRVLVFPEVHDGNRIAIAFSGPALDVSYAQLEARAKLIEDTLKLPARKWVKALKETTGARESSFAI